MQSNNLSLSALLDDCKDQKSISLPLEFEFIPVEVLSKEFTKLNNPHPYRIHYLGPRFNNTLSMHKKYSCSLKQEITNDRLPRYTVNTRKIVESGYVQQRLRVNTYYRSAIFYRAFEGMNPSLNCQEEYVFNSAFEGGNLDCVIKVKSCEFDLFLKIDSNTRGHAQWFYFSIANPNRKEKIKLNLCNLSKSKSLYSQGMQPYVLSTAKSKILGQQVWQQGAINLGLARTDLRYQILKQKSIPISYNCLTFEYEFEHENDQVYFAYCIPYTYSRLLSEINLLNVNYARIETLGKSLAGVDVPLLHITNHSDGRVKKNVLITGRIHPGESNSSFLLQSFIKLLCSPLKEANELRCKVNFFIIPMVNPDGVIAGNSRTSMAGKDLNRQYLQTRRELYPEVFMVQQFARRLQFRHGIFMYLDFHGHSRKKNTFLYGPAFSICEPNYYKCRIFPRLIQKMNRNFRFHSCSFTVDEEKKQTARAAMFMNLGVQYSYTIETSIGYFYDSQRKITQRFNRKEWEQMGKSICLAVNKFVIGFEEYESMIRERKASRARKSKAEMSLQPESNWEEEQTVSVNRMSPLKIQYRDKSLFSQIIEEFQVDRKHVESLDKHIDCLEDSDDHDSQEDLQISKMNEFDNLIIENARKSIGNAVNPKQSRITSPVRTQDQEEVRFIREIESAKQRPTRRPNSKQPPTRFDQRQIKDQIVPLQQTAVLYRSYDNNTELMHRQKRGAKFAKQLPCPKPSIKAEIVDKISHFGEYQLLLEKNMDQEKGLSIQRNSLFSRDKARLSHGKIQSQKPCEQTQPLQKRNLRIKRSNPISQQSKSFTFEFKFDGLESIAQEQERMNLFLRVKAHRQAKKSIRPTSFYAIRQNLNLKLQNERKKTYGDSICEKSFRTHGLSHEMLAYN